MSVDIGASPHPEVIVVDGTDVLDALPKTALARFDPVRAVLANIEAELKDYVADTSTKEGEAKAREHRKNLVKVRTGARGIYETLNAPMLAAQRDARALVALITTTAEKYEAPLNVAIKARDAEREVERLAAVAVEEARVAVIRTRLAVIANLPSTVAGMTSQQIGEVIGDVNEMPVSLERFAEFMEEARELVVRTVIRMEEMRAAESHREAAAEVLQRERDALVAQQQREAEEREVATSVAILHARIAAITSVPLSALGKTAAEIGEIIKSLVPPSADEFGNLSGIAMSAYTTAGVQLQGIYYGQRSTEQAASVAAAAVADEAARVAAARPVPDMNQADAFPAELVDESAADVVRIKAARVEKAAFVAEEHALTVDDEPVVVAEVKPAEPVVSQLAVPMDLSVPVAKQDEEAASGIIVVLGDMPHHPHISWKKITSTNVLLTIAVVHHLSNDDALNVLRGLNFVELEDYCAGIEVPF